MIDGIDMHHYTLAGPWASKGSATSFTEDQWFRSMRNATAVDELITPPLGDHGQVRSAEARRADRRRVGYVARSRARQQSRLPVPAEHDARRARRGGVARHLQPPRRPREMANIAQMVNVLQAMILTRRQQMLLTPTYHVFEMYTVHHDAVLLPLRLSSGAWYALGADSIHAVSVSASRDARGVVHITMSNLDPVRSQTAVLDLGSVRASAATGRIVTGPAMNSYNSFDKPDVVKPASFTGARIANGQLTAVLPAHSIVVLELR